MSLFRARRGARLLAALVVALLAALALVVTEAGGAEARVVQAEDFSAQSGAQTEPTADTGGGTNVAYLARGDWLAYAGVDLGSPGALTVALRVASLNTAGGAVEVRADSTTGPVLATVPIQSTGGWQTWATRTVTGTSTSAGTHTVYLTLTSSQPADFVNLNWFSVTAGGTSAPTTGVTSVALIDNVTRTPVLDPLPADAVITPAGHGLSIRATTTGSVASVVFDLVGSVGSPYTRTESVAPYFLCNDYADCPQLVTPGSYTLTVQAYAATGGTGAKVGGPLALSFRVAGGTTPTATPTAPAGALSVLYIGNSLIGTGTGATGEDTTAVVKHLATSTGRNLTSAKVIHFGNTLQETWNAGEVAGVLSGQTKYDFILLQEQSTYVALHPTEARNTLVNTYGPALARSLKTGGKVVLFKNWALTDPGSFPSRAANVAAINSGYAALSAALPLPNVIAPISDEFEKIIATRTPSYLILPDGRHPNDRAIYLDAATLYSIFFRQSPRTLPDLYLDTTTATLLRTTVATTLGY
jgi:hypothetical protein